ncbi:hypothetical protein IKM_05471 [Bacillus mycoides]|nr:hypothetical protein IKM_05471 [Bacillus mycoides]
MTKPTDFKWKHYEPEIILLTVRWYLRYNLSFRDLVEMMEERGLSMVLVQKMPSLCKLKVSINEDVLFDHQITHPHLLIPSVYTRMAFFAPEPYF